MSLFFLPVMGAATVKPWAWSPASAWSNGSTAVVLSDMGKCSPTSALSPRLAKKHWKLIPYETVEGISGKLAWACFDASAPALSLPLDTRGWHAIYVGIYGGNITPSTAWLRLDGDYAAIPRSYGKNPSAYLGIQEVFFKVADLRPDTKLNIEQQSAGERTGCGVAYVKLIPLSESEIAGYKADLGEAKTRRLTTTCDGFGEFYTYRPTSVTELRRNIEVFRNSDFGTLILHVGGVDQVNHPSEYGGGYYGKGNGDYTDPGNRNYAESIARLHAKGINPTKVFIDAAHDMGIKAQVGLRPAMNSYYEPITEMFRSPFYTKHPEWRTVDRDGTPVARLSWAVPEVRGLVVNILEEAVRLGADGANICFNRGLPVVLYEPPFCKLFQERYGEDAHKFEDMDPKIVQLRSEIVTSFFREVRAMLDGEQARRGDGKRLVISINTLGNEHDNLFYGIDLRQLSTEKLIDEVYVYPWNFGAMRANLDMDFLKEACVSKGVQISPMYYVGYGDEKIKAEALACFGKGASGIAFFDINVQANTPSWGFYSRLGHVDDYGNLKSPEPVFLRIHKIGEEIIDGRFGPWWGG
jgi:hypothetical protein